jgi:hypothetical protein
LLFQLFELVHYSLRQIPVNEDLIFSTMRSKVSGRRAATPFRLFGWSFSSEFRREDLKMASAELDKPCEQVERVHALVTSYCDRRIGAFG